jgi:hypothetical protein
LGQQEFPHWSYGIQLKQIRAKSVNAAAELATAVLFSLFQHDEALFAVQQLMMDDGSVLLAHPKK